MARTEVEISPILKYQLDTLPNNAQLSFAILVIPIWLVVTVIVIIFDAFLKWFNDKPVKGRKKK